MDFERTARYRQIVRERRVEPFMPPSSDESQAHRMGALSNRCRESRGCALVSTTRLSQGERGYDSLRSRRL